MITTVAFPNEANYIVEKVHGTKASAVGYSTHRIIKGSSMVDSSGSVLHESVHFTKTKRALQLEQVLFHVLPLTEFDELLHMIQTVLPRYVGVESITVYLYDEERGTFITEGFHGLYEVPLQRMNTLSAEFTTIINHCIRRRTPLILYDCLHSKDVLPDALVFKGVQSALLIRLGVRDKAYGVLQLEFLTRQHTFTSDEVEFYVLVADCIAIALENSQRVEEQKQKQNVWRETEESYYKFFESVPIGLFRCTPDGILLRVNPAMVKILGYVNREALLAVNISSLYVNPDERDRWRLEAEKSNGQFEKEIQMRRVDGTIIWVRHSITVVRSYDGSILYYDGAIADVSERREADLSLKEAYREKELLLKEIHHRVKNNLQIISSLLNLQSDYLRDPFDAELFKQSQARVKAMALLHEKLYQSPDLARIDFGAYLHSLVAHLFQSYTTSSMNIGYSIDADNIHFDIDTAIPCGLIVGELVSNCLKHAFKGRNEGHVWISVGHFDSKTIRLSVADNGVGMKLPSEGSPKSAALGLELVKTLSDQLAAVLDIQSHEGTRVTLLFKEKVQREGGRSLWQKRKS
ncbi:MAG: PAS domain S-box protein [Bacteroidetes bacterium]|nr:PAS domain S-box protein [Bacteroidota bacterium]